jgi:hypothetical protein
MNNSPEQLTNSWSAIHSGAGEAIRWIGEVRHGAPRLDSEADDLILNLLRQVRNKARRLRAASAQPMTVGFFGLSQAGKSYLISTLAAGENGKLETSLGGQRLDFLTHVNPPGGGKEATGLVTRFSRTAQPGPDKSFPLELKLFGEIELVKVLANSFFNDFDREKVQYRFKDDKIAQLLGELGKRRQAQRVPGVDEDDVVALRDYLKGSFKVSLEALSGRYWPEAVKLAPWLTVEDRTRLFSIFWGEISELNEAYESFARTLSRLDNADRVFAPLEALVRQGANGLSQADSIMNVDMLERLNKNSDQRISVRPVIGDEPRNPVELSLAQLAALTVELVFPLIEPTSDPLFNEVDLLDFPGYRGRLKLKSLDDVRRAMNREEASPVAPLILRGKVAYLFERYTDSQEMNVLIVCTPSNKQSDVSDVGPVLKRWIDETQGHDPEVRAKRNTGLLWAITMFDRRISDNLSMAEDLLRGSWGSGGMMKMTMLERFGQDSWLQEWAKGQPFDNTFLVRQPRRDDVTFLDRDGDKRETAVSSKWQEKLMLMRQTFCEDETVQRHVAKPEVAWDAMLALNDGGMKRIGDYLRGVARREVKLQRIGEQLKNVLDQLDTRLGPWFQAEGADELKKKQRIARQIFDAIVPVRLGLGELLQSMQLPDDRLRALYLRPSDDTPETAEAPTASSSALYSMDVDDGFSAMFGDAPPVASISTAPQATSSSAPQMSSSEARFAQAVLSEWKSYLNSLPEETDLMNFLGFGKAAIAALVDELKTAADRLKLQDSLLQAITGSEQSGTKREQLAGRQVLAANAVLGDFIGWLGFAGKPLEQRPHSRVPPGGIPLFQPMPEIPLGGLPQLPEKPLDYTSNYIADWLVGLTKLIEENAGHSAGREITPEQNEALGKVLDILHKAKAE